MARPCVAPALTGSLGAAVLTTTVHATAQRPPAPAAPLVSGAAVFNVRDFGATGDGKTLDTTAVQAAIDACHRERGGTVLVARRAISSSARSN